MSELNPQISTALRVVLPVIYIIVALIGIFGNLIVLQIICANRFRHKSIHLLVLSIVVADLLFIFIFTVVRAVSYAYLSTSWFINPNDWCKAEMYLLRLFDFVLAYTIVFMCLDRAVKMGSCWFGIRKFRTGISIVISIWIASAYVLIPILLFKQTIFSESYGGYLCYSTDESVPLFWLGAFPRRILDFIDIIFRVMVPIFLMIILLTIAVINLCRPSSASGLTTNTSVLSGTTATTPLVVDQAVSPSSASNTAAKTHGPNVSSNMSNSLSPTYRNSPLTTNQDITRTRPDISSSSRRLFLMVLSYAMVFAFCHLPFEIYRCVMLWNSNLETYLWTQSLDFAIEIPLLLLKLINRCINPFIFICLADSFGLRKKFCRCWLCPCCPGCIGCNQCWCTDCWNTIKYECNHCIGLHPEAKEDDWVPTGLQIISTHQYRDGDKLVTKQRILEEYETGVEPFYKNPRLRENLGIINETFENEDPYRLASIRTNQTITEDQRRIKL